MTGRPPLYSDPLLLEKKIDQYFDQFEKNDEKDVPSIAGLCYFLGFADRTALVEYEKRGATEDGPGPFSLTVKKARLRIEEDRSRRLIVGPNTAGVIFDLTNNHGWKNPQHVKHSGDEDGAPIETKDVTDREYARRVAFMLRRAAEQGSGEAQGGDAGADEGSKVVSEPGTSD